MSRWTDPAPEGSQMIVVLKDLNFEGQFINLGEPQSSFSQVLLDFTCKTFDFEAH